MGLRKVRCQKEGLLFLKKKKQKDFAPGGVCVGIAVNRHRWWRLTATLVYTPAIRNNPRIV